MVLYFATNNAHKLEEVRKILPIEYEVRSLRELGCTEDIPETSPTLAGNSLQKAEYVWSHYHVDCFADDTGLEVDALGGAPGVRTARYAGEPACDAANRQKLLSELNGKTDRCAHFSTVVTLIRSGEVQQVEGRVYGSIATEERGANGFGYDSLFIPEGYESTFAELPAEVKNQISHRARAMEALRKLL